MRCQDARKWMSPYLDSELGSTKTFEVSEHLRGCPACAARFDAERRTDQMIRERLSADAMPEELWSALSQAVTTPAWVRTLRAQRYWAIAACLVVGVTGALIFSSSPQLDGAPPLVQRFVSETPANRPFALAGAGIGLDTLNSFLDESMAMVFAGGSELMAKGHSEFQVVSANRRTDADGRPYLEVRLNCCGEPILLVMAKSDGGGWPAVLTASVDVTPGKSRRSTGGVNLAVKDLGDVRIMAASRHEVESVLNGFQRLSA